ncbi:MAG: hypothetical protein ICV85_18465, partial [Tolypothrix sp. T3-bin4]|nr:hypothetical protein [Tolypothrix sp. T3-bin4]
MRNALITANVFQNVFKNVLTPQVPSGTYYVDLLRRLAVQPIRWYMTAFDYNLARSFLDIFRLRGDRSDWEPYLALLNQVRIIPVDEHILDEAVFYSQRNFCESLRLACAVAHYLEAIVTWEPYLFTRTASERQECTNNWYFFVRIPAESVEPAPESSPYRIGVFSVGAFLLFLDDADRQRFLEGLRIQYFCLKECHLFCSAE